MKIDKKTGLGLTVAAAILFSGCTNQEAALAGSLANSAAGAAGVSTGGSGFNPYSTLSSASALKGVGQSQIVGAQMLANPAVLGVGAVGTAISEHNKAQNKKAFGDVADLYANSDGVNSKMENMMVQSYNKKYGTRFRTMQELQDYAKVTGYNKQEGTKFSTFGQVRADYNKKHGTKFKTNREFRAYLTSSR